MKRDEWKQIIRRWLRKTPRIIAAIGALANVGRFALMLMHHAP